VLAGLTTGETVFEYLTGAWKRLYQANREHNRLVSPSLNTLTQTFSPSDKASWTVTFDKLRGLVVSYCGMTLEDPTMFPQPAGRPTGPAEFLPLLLSLTPKSDAFGNIAEPVVQGALPPADILPFLNDLASGFGENLADVITPTLSLFFQEWYKLTPTPDILGDEWRRYLGAVATLVQVKPIAATVSPFLWGFADCSCRCYRYG
jgi:ubiquitin conjugation factor E4 B